MAAGDIIMSQTDGSSPAFPCGPCAPQDCHDFYGDTLEGILSPPTQCPCFFAGAFGVAHAYVGLDILDFPAAWTFNYSDPLWITSLAGSVDVYGSDDDCANVEFLGNVAILGQLECADIGDPDSTLTANFYADTLALLGYYAPLFSKTGIVLDTAAPNDLICGPPPGGPAGYGFASGGAVTISQP